MKKWIVTIIIAVLLIVMYMVIFGFSEQNAEKSSGLSLKVSKSAVNAADKIAKKHWSDKQKDEMAENIETPVRKLAHFSEYAVTGILICILLNQWMISKGKMIGVSAGWIFVSACIDEFHQTFVPGRDGNLFDVMIDTAGGMAGFLLTLLIIRLIWNKGKKKVSAS